MERPWHIGASLFGKGLTYLRYVTGASWENLSEQTAIASRYWITKWKQCNILLFPSRQTKNRGCWGTVCAAAFTGNGSNGFLLGFSAGVISCLGPTGDEEGEGGLSRSSHSYLSLGHVPWLSTLSFFRSALAASALSAASFLALSLFMQISAVVISFCTCGSQ